jgi:hypothetical protein
MENRYVAGGIVAVLLTAMVLVSAVSGLQASSHFLASPGQQKTGIFGANEEVAVATGNLNVSVSWCSDWTGVYCIPVTDVAVLVTNQTGSTVASSRTNADGQAQFAVVSPAVYTVTVYAGNDSALGFSYVNEYQVVQTAAGVTTDAPFVYIPAPILGW